MNGDGYDDFVTAAEVHGVSRIYTGFGGPSGVDLDLMRYQVHPELGNFAEFASGDFNADGRMDVGYRTGISRYPYTTSFVVTEGRSSGLNTAAASVFETPMRSISLDDINGDGFHDLATVVFARYMDGLSVVDIGRYVAYGGDAVGSGGVTAIPDSAFGLRRPPIISDMHTVGDLDGDGYADVVVGDWRFDNGKGRLLLFRGGATGLAASPSRSINNTFPAPEYGFGGNVTAVGDIDGDQLSDFTVWLGGFEALAVFRGSREELATLVGVIRSPSNYAPPGSGPSRTYFGLHTGTGSDIDGDGRAEIAIGCEGCFLRNDDAIFHGGVFVYRWNASGGLVLQWQDMQRYEGYPPGTIGASACGVGDVNVDGFDDLAVAMTPYGNSIKVYWGGTDGLVSSRVSSINGPPERTITDRSSIGTQIARRRAIEVVGRI